MSRCYGCMKYGVVYVAFIFLVTGIAIAALALYLLAEQEVSLDLAGDDAYLRYGKWFLLVAGGLMLLGGILGCCGGLRQSSALLSLFFSIVLLISLAELTAGVYTYIHRAEFADYFKALMTNSVKNLYGKDEYITKGWDMMQSEMHCCGATNFRDYSTNVLQHDKHTANNQGFIDMTLSALTPNSYMVPASCCQNLDPDECDKARNIPLTSGIPILGDVLTTSSIYKEGCADKFIEWAKTKASFIIGILIGIGSVQILCLLFTCILMCAFRGRRSSKY